MHTPTPDSNPDSEDDDGDIRRPPVPPDREDEIVPIEEPPKPGRRPDGPPMIAYEASLRLATLPNTGARSMLRA
jgi:hypothetical protein